MSALISGSTAAEAVAQSERARALREMNLGIAREGLIVTMASRLLYDKGVAEYVEAAGYWSGRAEADTVFVLAGSPDLENPDLSLSKTSKGGQGGGNIRVVGYRFRHACASRGIRRRCTSYVLSRRHPPRPHRGRCHVQAHRLDHHPRCCRDRRGRRQRHPGTSQRRRRPCQGNRELLDSPQLRAEYGSGRPAKGGTRVR